MLIINILEKIKRRYPHPISLFFLMGSLLNPVFLLSQDIDTLVLTEDSLDNWLEEVDIFEIVNYDASYDPFETKRKIPQRVLSAYHSRALKYIERFSKLAMGEMQKFGIPASITLAQGIIESGAGRSKMSRTINNHFGIKCKRRCRKCRCRRFTDDTKYDRFVVYPSAWASYRAHSRLLKKQRYKHCHAYDVTDYESWALGLAKAGYASDKHYAKKLIRVIELYSLYEWDEKALELEIVSGH